MYDFRLVVQCKLWETAVQSTTTLGMHLRGLDAETVMKGLDFSSRSLTCDSLHLFWAVVAVTPTNCAVPCNNKHDTSFY